MIPYMHSRSVQCKRCPEKFFYDFTICRRLPTVCPTCKARNRQAALERQHEKRKAATAEMTGREVAHLVVRTHQEVAEMMGISAEQVRQLERSALAKLRSVINKNNSKIIKI